MVQTPILIIFKINLIRIHPTLDSNYDHDKEQYIMSRKKISQIVGLTIGATAIAAGGIGSSIALTSCTDAISELQATTNLNLSAEDVEAAFGGVKSYLDSLTYDQITEDGFLDNPINQSICIQLIVNSLKDQVAGFNNTNIQNVGFKTQIIQNEVKFDTSVAIDDITITFANVTLPSDLTDNGYSVDESNPLAISKTCDYSYDNPKMVTIDNTSAQKIYDSISGYINTLNKSYYTNDINDNTEIVETAKAKVAAAAKIGLQDVKAVTFHVLGDEASNALVDMSFDIEFADNVVLNITDSTYFDAPVGQSISSSQSIQVANPNYDGRTLSSGYGAAIYNAVQTVMNQVSSLDFSQAFINQDRFKAAVIQEISKSGVDLNDGDFTDISFTLSGTETTSTQASLSFSFTFGDNISLVGWESNDLFNQDGQHTISTKVPMTLANKKFQKVQVQADQASGIYRAVVDNVKTLPADQLTNDYLNADYQATIKTQIVNAIGGSMSVDYLPSVNFSVGTMPGNNAYQNLNFQINFDNHVTVTSGDWTNFILLSNNDDTQSLSVQQPVVISTPGFEKISLDTSDTSAIYSAVQGQIQKLSQQANFSVDQLINPSAAFLNETKQAIVDGLSAKNLQIGDISNIVFLPTIDQANDNQLDVNFNLTFGPNVSVASSINSHGLENGQAPNTLISNQFVAVTNPSNNIPARPQLTAENLDSIYSVLTGAFSSLQPSEFATINDSNNFKDGLKLQIVTRLTSKGVKNFDVNCISNIELASSMNANTNMIEITPSIQFASKVDLSQISSGDANMSVDTSTNTISTKAPFTKQAVGAFINQAALNQINTIINSQYNDTFQANPNSVNQATLSNSQFVQRVLTSIINTLNQSPYNAQLNASNLSLAFTYQANDNGFGGKVGYQLDFNDVTFQPGVQAGDDFNFSASDKSGSLTNKNPITVNSIILDQTKVSAIYDTIKAQLPSNVADINDEHLKSMTSAIIGTINTSFGLDAASDQLISSLSFGVDVQTNSVNASVSFNPSVGIDGNINVQNVTGTGNTHQFNMVYSIDGLNNYVPSDTLSTINKIASEWVTNQVNTNLQAIVSSDAGFGPYMDSFYDQLSQNKINLGWIDRANTSFSIDWTHNKVNFQLGFSASANTDNLTIPSNTTFENKLFKASFDSVQAKLANVLTQTRLDSINNYAVQAATTVYQKAKAANNLAGLEDMLNAATTDGSLKVSNGVYQQVKQETGFNCNPNDMSNIWYTATLNDRTHKVDMSYQFCVNSNYTIPGNLNTQAFVTTQRPSNGGASFGTDYVFTNSSSIQAQPGLTRAIIDNNTLNNLVQAVQKVMQPLYNQTLVKGNTFKINSANVNDSIYNSAIINTFKQLAGSQYDNVLTSLTLKTTDAGDLNNGNIRLTVTLNTNANQVYFGDVSANPYFSVDTASGTISMKAPIPCGTGLYNFDGTYLQNLTHDGLEASQLILSSYTISNIATSAFLKAQAKDIDFGGCNYTGTRMANIFVQSGGSAYDGNDNVETVTLPLGISELPNNLFLSCGNLKVVNNLFNNPKITSLPQALFSYCPSLQEVVLPQHITYIGDRAFFGCSGVTNCDMSAATKLNDDSVYRALLVSNGIWSFSGVTSLKFPPQFNWNKLNANESGSPQYRVWSGLKSIKHPFDLTLPNNCQIKDNFFAWDNGQGIQVKNLYTNIITDIGTRAFANNKTIETFKISNQSDSFSYSYQIKEATFMNCSNLKYFDGFNIPRITGFMKDAFNGCTGQLNVYFNSTVNDFETGSFANCILRASDYLGISSYIAVKVNAFQNTRIVNLYGNDIAYNVAFPTDTTWDFKHDPSTQRCTIYGNGVLFSAPNMAYLRAQATSWEGSVWNPNHVTGTILGN